MPYFSKARQIPSAAAPVASTYINHPLLQIYSRCSKMQLKTTQLKEIN
jgi:hypothetical protein